MYYSEILQNNIYYTEENYQRETLSKKQRKNLSIIVNIFYVDLKIEFLLFKQLTCTEYYCVFQSTNKFFRHIEKRYNSEYRTKQIFVKIFYIDKTIVKSD